MQLLQRIFWEKIEMVRNHLKICKGKKETLEKENYDAPETLSSMDIDERKYKKV